MRDNRTNALPFPALVHGVTPGATGVAFALIRSLYYLPPLVYAVAAVVSARALFRRVPGGIVAALFVFFGVASWNQALWRSDLAHLLQALPPFYALSIGGIEAAAKRFHARGAIATAGAPLLMLFALLVYGETWRSDRGAGRIAAEGIQPIPPYYTGSVAQLGEPSVRLELPRAPLRVPPRQARFLRAVGERIDRYTSPGDSMLTVPGFQLLYFLFDRKNPTRYVHLRRALDNREEEEQYIRDILDGGTKLVILRDYAIDGREERRFTRFAAPVCAAIEREFDLVESMGDIRFYTPRGARP